MGSGAPEPSGPLPLSAAFHHTFSAIFLTQAGEAAVSFLTAGPGGGGLQADGPGVVMSTPEAEAGCSIAGPSGRPPRDEPGSEVLSPAPRLSPARCLLLEHRPGSAP